MTTVIDADDAATAAAQWWAGQMCPVFQNNGDPTGAGLLAGALAGIAAARHERPTDEQLERFVAVLAERITTTIAERTDRGPDGLARPPVVSLFVDYGPDLDLSAAADEAGIHYSVFPWKTAVWVHPDHVIVSAGYRGRHELVWAADSYEPEPCHVQAWDHVAGHYLPGKCGQDRYHEGLCDSAVLSPLCVHCGGPDIRLVHQPSWGAGPDHEFEAADV